MRTLLLLVVVSLHAVSARAEIEEVVVTAQKRSSTLQDTPISLSVVQGEDLDLQQISNFSELADNIPSVQFVASPGDDVSIGIRGIHTSTGNAGFEQSVGVYLDGVYIPRGRLYSLAFLDVDRIEVLKGPQAVIQGKNSVAGAINIISRTPSREFEAGIGGGLEFANDSSVIDGYIGGALSDTVSAKLVVRHTDTGGWLDFPRAGHSDQNETENLGIRASIEITPSDTSTISAQYTRMESDIDGVAFGVFDIQPSVAGPTLALYQALDPDFGFIEDEIVSNGLLLDVDAANNVVISNREAFNTTDTNVFAVTYNNDFEKGVFTSITSYLEYETRSRYAFSMQPIDFVSQGDQEDYEQITQEIRWTSPGDQTFDYLIGLFYQTSDLSFGRPTNIINAVALGLPDVFNVRVPDGFEQDSESISIFGQGSLKLSGQVTLTAGLRYTHEKKDADGFLALLSTDGQMAVGGVGPGDPAFNPIADLYGTAWRASDSRTESSVDPSIGVQWDVSDDAMVYLNWTGATKSGGFNAADTTGTNFEYEEEESSGFELGAKLKLLDNRLHWNVALFETEFVDLQVNSFDSNVNAFVTRNAAEATTRGIETDIVFAATDHIELGASVLFLDAEYDSYPGATCSVGESEEPNCIGSTRDAAGDELRQAPDLSASAYIDVAAPVSDTLELGVRVIVNWTDDYFMAATNDRFTRVDAFSKVDVVLSLSSADQRWVVSLVGKNLSDEITPYFANNAPLNDPVYFSSVQVGREIFLQGTYRF